MSGMKGVFPAAVVVFLLDQLSKALIVHVLNLRELGSIDVLPPFLNFRMAWNYGINFGLFDTSRWVLIAVAVVISAWVIVWVRGSGAGLMARLSAGVLVGGAAGNVFDRLIYGAVADFLNMSCCGINNPYAFNIADVAVFAGAVGLLLFAPGNKTP